MFKDTCRLAFQATQRCSGQAPSKALQPPMPSQASLLDKCTTRRISARTCQM